MAWWQIIIIQAFCICNIRMAIFDCKTKERILIWIEYCVSEVRLTALQSRCWHCNNRFCYIFCTLHTFGIAYFEYVFYRQRILRHPIKTHKMHRARFRGGCVCFGILIFQYFDSNAFPFRSTFCLIVMF